MKRAVITVFGKVQGVFFRDSTKKEARKLGITGTARNKEDGTVEIVAEGEADKLKQLIEWCNVGPEYAKVEKVDVEWHDAERGFEDFKTISTR